MEWARHRERFRTFFWLSKWLCVSILCFDWRRERERETSRFDVLMFEVSIPYVWGTIDKLFTQGLQPRVSRVFCDSAREIDWCTFHLCIVFVSPGCENFSESRCIARLSLGQLSCYLPYLGHLLLGMRRLRDHFTTFKLFLKLLLCGEAVLGIQSCYTRLCWHGNVADRKRKLFFVDSRPVYTRKAKTRTNVFGSKMLPKTEDLSYDDGNWNAATNAKNAFFPGVVYEKSGCADVSLFPCKR